jgi:hypothetical protein
MSRSYRSSPPSAVVACSGTALALYMYNLKGMLKHGERDEQHLFILLRLETGSEVTLYSFISWLSVVTLTVNISFMFLFCYSGYYSPGNQITRDGLSLCSFSVAV